MSAATVLGGQEVSGVGRIEGPIVIVRGGTNVSYDEVVEIRDSRGNIRRGRVLEVGEDNAVVQVFAGSTGLSIDETRIRFLGETLHMPVAEEMLGRVFDGLGNPIDGGPAPLTDRFADVNGQPINPTARIYPHDYIQTGISTIDGLNTLLRGQKLPIFSGAGLPLAEYLAYEREMHVLVVLTDMTNYGEALRQISNIRGEVPSRKGYPGYLYSDLASMYERTGRVRSSKGSITQIPILTRPNDDITHPMPDLTGYITEGQIVLGRELSFAGVYPPVTVLPSLSRLMKDGIGKGRTRDDHPRWGAQLYAAYARTQDIRALASVIGEEELSDTDQKYLKFGRAFEHEFVNQGFTENRSIDRTLEIGWKLLSMLPKSELTRVTLDEIAQYYKGEDATN